MTANHEYPDISDHALVSYDISEAEGYIRQTFCAPAFQELTTQDPEAIERAFEQHWDANEFNALLAAGDVDAAWGLLSDTGEMALGAKLQEGAKRGSGWDPIPLEGPRGRAGACGHESGHLRLLRKLRGQLHQLRVQPHCPHRWRRASQSVASLRGFNPVSRTLTSTTMSTTWHGSTTSMPIRPALNGGSGSGNGERKRLLLKSKLSPGSNGLRMRLGSWSNPLLTRRIHLALCILPGSWSSKLRYGETDGPRQRGQSNLKHWTICSPLCRSPHSTLPRLISRLRTLYERQGPCRANRLDLTNGHPSFFFDYLVVGGRSWPSFGIRFGSKGKRPGYGADLSSPFSKSQTKRRGRSHFAVSSGALAPGSLTANSVDGWRLGWARIPRVLRLDEAPKTLRPSSDRPGCR